MIQRVNRWNLLCKWHDSFVDRNIGFHLSHWKPVRFIAPWNAGKWYWKRFLKARVLSRLWVVGQLGACRPIVHGSTLSCRVVGTSFFDPPALPQLSWGMGFGRKKSSARNLFCSCARFVRLVDAHLWGAEPFRCDLLPEYHRPAFANTTAKKECVESSYIVFLW